MDAIYKLMQIVLGAVQGTKHAEMISEYLDTFSPGMVVHQLEIDGRLLAERRGSHHVSASLHPGMGIQLG